MPKVHDLGGKRFGKLVALDYFRERGNTYWVCRCDCGRETRVLAANLKSGGTKQLESE
jgi:hypothetical protein